MCRKTFLQNTHSCLNPIDEEEKLAHNISKLLWFKNFAYLRFIWITTYYWEKKHNHMRTTFLIGNGFDLNSGFRTKYSDFFDYYLSKNITKLTPGIIKFRKGLIGNPDDWSDLELALGRFSEEFDTEAEFVDILEHIQDELALYFSNLDTKFIIDNEERTKANCDLVDFDKYFTERDKQEFRNFKHLKDLSTNEVGIISFNYTSSIETVFDWKGRSQQFKSLSSMSNTNLQYRLSSIEHIHGTFKDNMLIGVNDKSQIKNPRFQNSKPVVRSIVKPEMNKNTESLREARCVKLINAANTICVFGMSLGETDKFWWKTIGEHLVLSDTKLVIFSICDALPPIRAYKTATIKERIQDKFLSYLNYSEEDKARIREKIIVCLNSPMFKVASISKHDEFLKSAEAFSKQIESVRQKLPKWMNN